MCKIIFLYCEKDLNRNAVFIAPSFIIISVISRFNMGLDTNSVSLLGNKHYTRFMLTGVLSLLMKTVVSILTNLGREKGSQLSPVIQFDQETLVFIYTNGIQGPFPILYYSGSQELSFKTISCTFSLDL